MLHDSEASNHADRFDKTRQHDQRQIDRAVRAQQACEREHRRPAEQTYERQA